VDVPILFPSSSWAAVLDSDYGLSKRLAEEEILRMSQGIVFRLNNIFGPGAQVYYKNVIATFSYNIQHGIPIEINDPAAEIDFIYVDDFAKAFVKAVLNPQKYSGKINSIEPKSRISVGELADLLKSFKGLASPPDDSYFTKRLFETFASYEEFDLAEQVL